MSSEASQPFEIKDVEGVKLIYGGLSLEATAQLFNVIADHLGDETVLDTSGIAARHGAKFAVGLPSDVEKLSKRVG